MGADKANYDSAFQLRYPTRVRVPDFVFNTKTYKSVSDDLKRFYENFQISGESQQAYSGLLTRLDLRKGAAKKRVYGKPEAIKAILKQARKQDSCDCCPDFLKSCCSKPEPISESTPHCTLEAWPKPVRNDSAYAKSTCKWVWKCIKPWYMPIKSCCKSWWKDIRAYCCCCKSSTPAPQDGTTPQSDTTPQQPDTPTQPDTDTPDSNQEPWACKVCGLLTNVDTHCVICGTLKGQEANFDADTLKSFKETAAANNLEADAQGTSQSATGTETPKDDDRNWFLKMSTGMQALVIILAAVSLIAIILALICGCKKDSPKARNVHRMHYGEKPSRRQSRRASRSRYASRTRHGSRYRSRV